MEPQTLAQFINNEQVQIPQQFVQRFIYNYEHKSEWYQSDKAYDEWFNKYYNKYADFIRAIKRELVEQIDYSNISPRGDKIKGRPKDLYLISFDALKQLEMKCDKETRIYYVQLEKLNQQYLEYQQTLYQQNQLEQEQKIKEQQQLIEQYESMKKRGVIYEIYNVNDQNENYIGQHEGIDPNDRFKTHIQSALQSLKQPLYRRIFREGLKSFKIRKIKSVDFYHTDELLKEEEKMIEALNPALNRGFLFECDCGRELKQEDAIMKHRQDCCQYIKKLSNN